MPQQFGVLRPGLTRRPSDHLAAAAPSLRLLPRRPLALRPARLCRATGATSALRIVFVSPEVAPWSKVGGLADVLAALPQALAARGHRVMTVAPRYACYDDVAATGVRVPLELPPGLTLPAAGEAEEGESPGAEEDAGETAGALLAGGGEAGSSGGSEAGSSGGSEAGSSGGSEAGSSGGSEGAGGSDLEDNSGGEQPAAAGPHSGGAGGESLPPHAEYHLCRQGGVDRVFVDHPLFLGAAIYGRPPGCSSGASSGVYTYTHLTGAHHPLVELQYNVLCQAALAAPLLLWERSAGGAGGAAAQLGGASAAEAAAAGTAADSHGPEAGGDGPLVFCANDWPSALLPLRLHHRVRSGGEASGLPWPGLSSSLLAPQAGEQQPEQQPAQQEDPTALQEPDAAAASEAVRQLYAELRPYLQAATAAYCIHNLAYQGQVPASALPFLGLPVAAAGELCAGGDWRRELAGLEAERAAWRQGGSSYSPPTPASTSSQAEGQRGSCRGSGGGEVPPAGDAGPQLQRPRQEGEEEEGPSVRGAQQQQRRQQKQRRWRWKRKLREQAAASEQQQEQQQQHGQQRQPVLADAVEAALLGEPVGECSSTSSGSEAQSTPVVTEDAAAATAVAAACPSRQFNLKQGALLASDALVTVSPGYAVEVQQDPGMGCGMQDILATRGITGIMNGIDVAEWDPATDRHLPPEARYTAATVSTGKARAKALLQERLGLRVDPAVPLVGFVGRLTAQKGVDVLLGAAPALLMAPPAPAPTPASRPPPLPRPVSTGADSSEGGSISGSERGPGQQGEWGGGGPAVAAAVAMLRAVAGAHAEPAAPAPVSRHDVEARQPGGPAVPEHSCGGGHGLRRRAGVKKGSLRPPPRHHAVAMSPISLTNALRPACLAVSGSTEEEGPNSLPASGPEGLEEAPGRAAAPAADAAETAAAAAPAHTLAAAGSARGALQLAVLGTGERWMEAALGGLEQSFRGQAAGVTAFSEELAHWIMAGCDYLLVPSRFEPCGLVAQCAVRYGAVPIVTAVGGLKDLVVPEVGYTVRPFGFDTVASTHRQNILELTWAVQAAVAEYGTEPYLRRQQRCMALDVSWDKPAAEWEALFLRMAASAAEGGSEELAPAGEEC